MGPLQWAVRLSLLLMSSPSLFAEGSDPCHAYGALLRDAIRLLSEEHRFTCDAQHLVIVRAAKKFTLSLPDSDRAEVARTLRQRWVWAFVLHRKFPIYVLQTGEQGRIAERYALGQVPWLRFFVSCVLVHEHSHIVYQIDDGAAYRKQLEYSSDPRFREVLSLSGAKTAQSGPHPGFAGIQCT